MVTIKDKIYFVSEEVFCLEACSRKNIRAVQLLREGCDRSQLYDLLGKSDGNQLVELLGSIGVMRMNFRNEYCGTEVEKQIYYFDSFSKVPNAMQKAISRKCVAILGMGGVGSVVLQNLIGAGVQSFILIDGDRVNQSNFNRQFIFSSADIGELKVDAAKKICT